ncbi:MAG: S-methyl-5'-thioadenosine phosphorylase [Bosea sp.]|jgi:5'-methylthioadenosine phosphorylase|nr:S-methyl-5'-thioadenosine phosphorylase [Bosea sp. (in: a-proteobacteria)]
MVKSILGVIGGSGVYDLPGMEDVEERTVATPWGAPSDSLRIGRIGATTVVFLPRHGRGHLFSPSDINYRANIDAMKRMGVTDIVALSACGSLKAQLHPGLLVFVDQFVDRTFRRASSFFGAGCVAHVSMAHPVGPLLQARLAKAARDEDVPAVTGGTYLCMEGPQFSSLAESQGYRASGHDVIGMTNMPEAKLAREAEITYATVAMVTDFDCWHPEHDVVDVAAVIATVKSNAASAARLIARLARDFPAEHEACPVKSDRALDGAIMTRPDARDPALLAKLDAVAGRVLRLERAARSLPPDAGSTACAIANS